MNIKLNYLLLFYCIAVLDAVKFRCDYTYYKDFWLKYHEIPMTWNDARLYCHLQGTMLASPTTILISDKMQSLIQNCEIFTGIHSTFSKGQYYSLDGIPLSEIPHSWARFEPDNKNNEESCIALNYDGYMSVINCSETRPFMCFRKKSDIDVNICGTLDSEYHHYNLTNKCYKLHTKPRNFKEANFACSAEGGHLAVINSDEEANVISQIFARYPVKKIFGIFWKKHASIGFYFWKENNEWMTVHGQSIQDAGYAKFAAGEPNNANNNEYCGSVNHAGLLNDANCDQRYLSICEKDPTFPFICEDF